MIFKKTLISTLSLVAIMFGTLAPALSTVAADSKVIAIDAAEDMLKRLPDGEAVVSTEVEDKPYWEVDISVNIVSKEDWENTAIGEYPIDEHSEKWSQLSSIERTAVCNMPKEYVENLTTEELVDYAVNYPFLMDLLAFDHIADGMNNLAKKSSLFEELFSRSDCCEELLIEYLNMEINYSELAESNDVCETHYDSELFIEAYIGLNFDLLSENQAVRFVEEYGNKYSNINSECQEPVLSTLFYGAIEEKMGLVPEDAVPESVAANFVDTIDAASAAFELGIISTCKYCKASQLNTSITINEKIVYCYKWLSGGLTETEIAQMDSYIANLYPSYIKVRNASSKYNCHSYAWYSTGTSNVFWIDDPSSVYSNTKYWTEWKIPMRNLREGDRITFRSGNSLLHSAIVSGSTDCISKLGHYGLYKSTISEMESYYNSSSTQAYIPK